MGVKRGDLMLLKHGDGGSPEAFTAVAGLRSKSLTFNAESVDVTNADDVSKWRQLLPAVGIMSISLSGSGLFKDDAISGTINGRALGQNIDNWQLYVVGLGSFTGPFQINQLKYDGDYKDGLTFDISLESAGDVTFAAG